MTIAIGRSNRAPTQVTSVSTLAIGARGSTVSTLQSMLSQAGFNPRGIDGIFGPKTDAAVRRFQASQGLVRDGVVGATTWAALSASAVGVAPRAAGSSTVRPGDSGTDVKSLQTMLARAGFDTDGIDGQFGPATRQAVTAFQRQARIDADGVVGTDTWRALAASASGPAMSAPRAPVTPRASAPRPAAPAAVRGPAAPASTEFRQRILDIARGEIGIVEKTNRNDGEVTKYPNAFGRGTEKWCADFTSWVCNQAGGELNDPYTPSVVNRLKAKDLWKGTDDPEPGDLVLFDWNHDKKADHIGLVEFVNADGSIGTIEGNTNNPTTGQEGVWRRERALSTVLGFGEPF